MVLYDASGVGLGDMLMQKGKIIVDGSKKLKTHEKNYLNRDLELTVVTFVLKLW